MLHPSDIQGVGYDSHPHIFIALTLNSSDGFSFPPWWGLGEWPPFHQYLHLLKWPIIPISVLSMPTFPQTRGWSVLDFLAIELEILLALDKNHFVFFSCACLGRMVAIQPIFTFTEVAEWSHLCIDPTELSVTARRSIIASLPIWLRVWWDSKNIQKFKTTNSMETICFWTFPKLTQICKATIIAAIELCYRTNQFTHLTFELVKLNHQRPPILVRKNSICNSTKFRRTN